MKQKYVGLIRKLVYKTGLSIADLSIEIEASEKSIYKWMNGTSCPNCGHILSLISLVEAKENREIKTGF